MDFDFCGAQKTIGYEFTNKGLLKTAFTHSSYANEHKNTLSNERLEFLGDSLLGFIAAEYFFLRSGEDEGKLTVKKKNLVSSLPLSTCVLKEGYEKFLLLGKGEEAQFALGKKSASENLFEAITGAIYLDGGIENAKKFVYDKLLSHIDDFLSARDYKSELQNYVQANKSLGKIEYKIIDKSGPDHKPTFVSAVYVGDEKIATGQGGKISDAEKQAARYALEYLKKEEI